ncbi:MAG TPA: hypothetical protein DEG76_04040 [Pseudohongiella sp.]|nr:hypothetical protein [Pseudohongiella sp.]MAO39460.1 hypothetical protein [Pseudohongiella sp.]MAY56917.1 hypothetical protein [Gammaproteobacteria bacterium]MBJ56394.1 hypothetical protein [Gammaproteobacteria bacterium]HBX36501.1 hypothetical protein [Pseudohongiella sp.]|tara:strand:+ start:3395 stop:4168 length:774 start_codon:yes stop_codon:yes gene_type:complete
MLVFFSLVLSLALVCAIAYVLHRHQQRARVDAVERERSLPPLDVEVPELEPEAAQSPTEESETSTEEPEQRVTETATTDPEPAPEVEKESREQNHANKSEQEASPSPAALAGDWKQLAQSLKNQGDYDAALSACNVAWPQLQGYQQAAIIARAAARAATEESRADWLQTLYRLAAEASLLHDKVPGVPDLKWQSLSQRFTAEQIAQIELPWRELGHEHMRLLNKTDSRQMVDLWGEPERQQSAKAYHRSLFEPSEPA